MRRLEVRVSLSLSCNLYESWLIEYSVKRQFHFCGSICTCLSEDCHLRILLRHPASPDFPNCFHPPSFPFGDDWDAAFPWDFVVPFHLVWHGPFDSSITTTLPTATPWFRTCPFFDFGVLQFASLQPACAARADRMSALPPFYQFALEGRHISLFALLLAMDSSIT